MKQRYAPNSHIRLASGQRHKSSAQLAARIAADEAASPDNSRAQSIFEHAAKPSELDGSPAVAGHTERTILNISSIAKWRGPAVGILRVEQALAAHALARRPDIVLSIYDRAAASFLAVSPIWAAHIVSW